MRSKIILIAIGAAAGGAMFLALQGIHQVVAYTAFAILVARFLLLVIKELRFPSPGGR